MAKFAYACKTCGGDKLRFSAQVVHNGTTDPLIRGTKAGNLWAFSILDVWTVQAACDNCEDVVDVKEVR